MLGFASSHERAFKFKDQLARHWWALFLDAQPAATLAPAVAAEREEEIGLDPQLNKFLELCQQDLLGDKRFEEALVAPNTDTAP